MGSRVPTGVRYSCARSGKGDHLKKLKRLIAGLLIFTPSLALAKVAGKLDLANPVVDVIVLRELHDGMWLGGAQKTIWKLNSIDRHNADGTPSDDVEVLHVAAFWASRPEVNSNKAYGLSVGLNVGGVAHELALKVAGIAELVYACPPWVGKVGNWTSLDTFVGGRPTVGYDEHHLIYGIGGKVTIPLADLWAFISKAQGGGL